MIKKIYIHILFIAVLTGCGVKEEKLPANVDFTNTILFTADTNSNELKDPQIFAVKVDSSHTLYQLTDTRYPLEDPVWLPDGSGIVFLERRFETGLYDDGIVGWQDNPDIYIMDTSGTRRIIRCWENMPKNEREKYKELKGGIFSIVPTSSGKIIFNLGGYEFIAHDTVQSKISFNVIKRNPELAHIFGDFALSPDEKKVAFSTQLETEKKRLPSTIPDSLSRGAYDASITEIFEMSIEDGTYKRLTNNNLPDFDPCWSNDGKKIYFSRNTDWSIKRYSKHFQSDIFVMDSDGKNQKNLTDSPDISEYTPKVSPDDKFIAYIVEEMEDDKYTEIWIMNNDGSNKRKIIGLHAHNCGEISWYPKK
jgi:Tol biopolymer transport system component